LFALLRLERKTACQRRQRETAIKTAHELHSFYSHYHEARWIRYSKPSVIKMVEFLASGRAEPKPEVPVALGHLESTVMEILWNRGESSVHDVTQQLERSLAYTTIMTTLDRLFKKGLLNRRKIERAFLYAPRLSRVEWEQKRTGEFVAAFLSRPQPAGDLLISCLVEAVGERDEALLDELERKIKLKRKELRNKP
jgi:predicted transcriptional regulator